MSKLVPEITDKSLEFTVVLRGDILKEQFRKSKGVHILLEILTPGIGIHVLQQNPALLGTDEGIIVAVLDIKVVAAYLFSLDELVVPVNLLDSLIDQIHHTGQSQPEGIDRALKPLEHQNTHQTTDTHLSAQGGQTLGHLRIYVLAQFTRQDES